MKAINMLAGIIAIIALAGDVFFMYVLYSLGQLATDFSQLASSDASVADLQQVGQALSFGINIGWLWSVLVLIACLFAIKYSLFDSRKK